MRNWRTVFAVVYMYMRIADNYSTADAPLQFLFIGKETLLLGNNSLHAEVHGSSAGSSDWSSVRATTVGKGHIWIPSSIMYIYRGA